MFEKLFDTANHKLIHLEETVIGLPEPQVTVLATENNLYVAVNDIDGLICDELKQKEDTNIICMLTMWKNGGVDLSSLKFRQKLVKLNEYNYNTNIFLQGKEGFHIKKLSETML